MTEDTDDIPQHLEIYIDYDRMGRDMELNGDIYTIETGYEEVHVFFYHQHDWQTRIEAHAKMLQSSVSK